MAEHKVAGEVDEGWFRVNVLYKMGLRCTCGRRFSACGRTKKKALQNAEARFREHLPIR